MRVRRSPARHGASVKPQLPITTVVTPCQDEQEARRVPRELGVVVGVRIDEAGRDDQSGGVDISRRRGPSPSPTSAQPAVRTATSARRPGAPVPSTTSPPRITRSCAAAWAVPWVAVCMVMGGLLYGNCMVLDHPSARRYPPSTMLKRAAVESTAEAYLELLAARGVEYLFANAGTDFAPLIEAYAKRGAQGQAAPRPITVPHEIPAVAMAHGYAMVTGRAAGGHGPRDRGRRQRRRRHHQRRALQRADALQRRAQPDHRGGPLRAAATAPSTGRRSRSTRRPWSANS